MHILPAPFLTAMKADCSPQGLTLHAHYDQAAPPRRECIVVGLKSPLLMDLGRGQPVRIERKVEVTTIRLCSKQTQRPPRLGVVTKLLLQRSDHALHAPHSPVLLRH